MGIKEKILLLKVFVENIRKKRRNKISKTSKFYLLKNKEKYKYLKTMPKTNKLAESFLLK